MTCGFAGSNHNCMINAGGGGRGECAGRLAGVIEAVVTTVLVAVFLLIAGFAAFTVRRLYRDTAEPGQDH